MTNQDRNVYVGVDTHRDIHVVAVLDDSGKLLNTKSFPTSPLGLRQCEHWIARHGRTLGIGVEGTGTYGHALAGLLTGAGHRVVEVNRPNRQMRRARGKSDTVDAEAAARAVLAGHATGIPKSHDGVVESIRVLRTTLKTTRATRVRIGQQLWHLMVTAPEDLRVEYGQLAVEDLVARAARFRISSDCVDCVGVTKQALRILARQYQALSNDLNALRSRLHKLVEMANPGLLQAFGVGVDTASALIVAAGDNPERLHSEAAFAALCGAAPIEASSGKTSNHRLSRGGNRDANEALWRIAMVRMSRDPKTRDYVARRTTQGMSKRAIMRCLKRFIAREIFHHLVAPKPAVQFDELRALRKQLRMPLRVPATALGLGQITISRIERGLETSIRHTTRYADWLNQQPAHAS